MHKMISKLLSRIPVLLFVISITEAAPPNDTCENPLPIEGQGAFAFDNTEATYEGFLPSDVWYCWTSPFTGTVSIDTCSGTTVDTFLRVYKDCSCPPAGARLIDSDDSCATQSRGSFAARAGQEYLVEIGTKFDFVLGGPGTLYIDYGPDQQWPDLPVACHYDPNFGVTLSMCQPHDRWDVTTSDRDTAIVADNFAPAADGEISELCWWGTYLNDLGNWGDESIDRFEVRYFENDGGMPGALIAGPFSQASGSLAVNGPVLELGLFHSGQRKYGFSATHAPVSVLADQCYWLEITNASLFGSQWQWAHAISGDGRSLRDGGLGIQPDGFDALDVLGEDMAFCPHLDLATEFECYAAPDHDSCVDSRFIDEGLHPIDTAGATTDGPVVPLMEFSEPSACGFPLGDDQIHRDVWYDYVAPCSGLLTLSLCGSDFDTKIAVYPFGDCADLDQPIACNDDACGDDPGYPSVLRMQLEQGAALLIRIGGYDGAFGRGVIDLDFAITPPTFGDLATYADFASCFTGPCTSPPCESLSDSTSCCHAQDFDADGDVDAEDLIGLMAILSGPPLELTVTHPDDRPDFEEAKTAPVSRSDGSFPVPAAFGIPVP